ncbi:MAG TPA: ATP-binding protein, partial [Ktedonobacteraceae bacterium]
MQRQQGDAISQHHLQAGASSSTQTQPPLVGRRAEMDRLAAQLERAAHGQGCAMFLAGEAGIGKTRLAHEALVLAREQGFLVLEGSAYALEGRLAYAPILAAFGPFLRRLDSPRQARLVSGLPDLGRLFTDLRLPAAEPLGDSALEKTRLFEAVARLLE